MMVEAAEGDVLFPCWTDDRFNKKDKHRTSNAQHRMMNKKTINDLLEETEQLIKIFVTSIKTAEKKKE